MIDKPSQKKKLLALAEKIGVDDACELISVCKNTYHRTKKMYEAGGDLFLRDEARVNIFSKKMEIIAAKYALAFPMHSEGMAAKKLKEKGLKISQGSIRWHWIKWGLNTEVDRLFAAKNSAKLTKKIELLEKRLGMLEKLEYGETILTNIKRKLKIRICLGLPYQLGDDLVNNFAEDYENLLNKYSIPEVVELSDVSINGE
jgi:hypothetical protein